MKKELPRETNRQKATSKKIRNFWDNTLTVTDEVSKTSTLVVGMNVCSKVTEWHLQQLNQYLSKNTVFKVVRVIFSDNKANDNHNEIVLFSNFIAENKTIVSLDLSSNKINPAEIKKLAEGLTKNSVIENLNLSGNSIGDDGLKHLAHFLEVNNNCRLKKLNLSLNHINALGMVYLEKALKVKKNLTELNLTGNNCNDSGAGSLAAALNHNCALEKLILTFNNIGNGGVDCLANALKANSNLLELNLSKNKFTDLGSKKLANALVENKMLRCIDLSGNKISEDALKYFVRKIKGDPHLKGNYYLTKITLLHAFFFKRKNASLFTELNKIVKNNKQFRSNVQKTAIRVCWTLKWMNKYKFFRSGSRKIVSKKVSAAAYDLEVQDMLNLLSQKK